VAAIAFAYAPWRASQAAHLHILSSGGIALAVFLLLRGYRRRSSWYITAGWLAAAWQVSLGFSLGLPFLYALLIVLPFIVWGHLRGALAATIGGGVALAAITLALAIPYFHVRDDHPEARRSLATVTAFSPRPVSFLVAPPENVVWGYATSGLLDEVSAKNAFAPNAEKTLFPGLAAVLLAVVGVAGPPLGRRLRIGLGVATLVLAVFALGTSLGQYAPYRLLYEFAPGFDGIRTPGRLAAFYTLTLALLAGAGTDRIASRTRGIGSTLVLLIPVVVLFEGWAPPTVVGVPKEPAGFAAVPGPVLHLPSSRFDDPRYVFWSTDGFTPIVNGWSGFDPQSLRQARAATRNFPATGRPFVRRLGVRSVVVHDDKGRMRVYR
jgi:hypothetical protein